MERAGHFNAPGRQQPLIQFASVEGTLPAQQLQETLQQILTELAAEHKEKGPTLARYKRGFFQSLGGSHTWVGRGADDSFGLHHTRAFMSVAVPLPRRDFPLVIQSSFGLYSFSGPDSFDVPSRLYESALSLIWLPKLSERWQGIVAVAPGIYSDFDAATSDSLRIKGLGLLKHHWNEQLEVQMGVVYLDRADITVVPAVGFVWRPNDDTLFEMSMPRPRIARRIFAGFDPTYGPRETWIYMVGELGGETWTVETGPSSHRLMSLREYRLLAGIEGVRNGGGGWRIESGIALDRRLLFTGPDQTIRGDDAFVLRASVTW